MMTPLLLHLSQDLPFLLSLDAHQNALCSRSSRNGNAPIIDPVAFVAGLHFFAKAAVVEFFRPWRHFVLLFLDGLGAVLATGGRVDAMPCSSTYLDEIESKPIYPEQRDCFRPAERQSQHSSCLLERTVTLVLALWT